MKAGICLIAWMAVTLSGQASDALPPLRIVLGETEIDEQCQTLAGDILHEALVARAGLNIVCDSQPWARAQVMVQQGERDAMLTVRTSERDRYTRTGEVPAMTLNIVMFTRRQHPLLSSLQKIRHLSELAPYQVLSYHGDGWSKKHLAPLSIPIEYSDDLRSVLLKLSRGRGDVFLQSDLDTWQQIRWLKLDTELIMLPTAFEALPYYLLIRSGSPYVEKLPKMDQAFAAMQFDGSLDKLYQRYR